MARLFAMVLVAMTVGACDLPRDPERTLERITGGVMRVGLIDHPPWTVAEGEPAGAEVALVRALADDLDATIRWHEGSAAEVLAALEHREIDLAIGGLTADDPWTSRVTLTKPYARIPTVIGVEPGATPPEDLDGVRVAVEEASETVALLTRQNAIPVEVSDLQDAEPPVAGEPWEIRALDLQPTDIVIGESAHVVGVPHGENAWTVRVERFLRSRVRRVPELLEAHAV